MKLESTNFEKLKLWTITPWLFLSGITGIIGVIFAIILNIDYYAWSIFNIYLYLLILVWIVWTLYRSEIRFVNLSTKESVKIPWLKLLVFTPFVKFTSAAIMALVGLVFLYLFPDIFSSVSNDIDNQLQPFETFLSFITVIILAPFVEELFFRGMLLNKWRNKFGLFKGILLTSLIFALIHPFNFFAAFLTSILYSLLYVKTKKIYVPILAHAIGNLLAFIPSFLIKPQAVNANENISTTLIDIGVMFGLTIFTLSISTYGLYRMYPKQKVS